MKSEFQLISTITKHPELLTTLSVEPKQFGDKNAAHIFQTVIGIIADKKTPDIIMIAETLAFQNSGDWMSRVSEVLSYPAVPANLEVYENRIIATYKMRQIEIIGRTLAANCTSENAMAEAIASLRALDQQGTNKIEDIGSATNIAIQLADDIQNNRIPSALKTGISELDRLTGGVRGGESIVLAARTSVGKTAVMCNLAVNFDCPVGIISGEQGSVQIAQRMLARIGGVDAYRIRNGKLGKDDWRNLIDAGKQLEEKPIFIVDKSRPTIEFIEQQARKMKWDHDIGALCIDYLQLIKNDRYTDKRSQVSDTSQRIKALAQELDIPVIILAQLNRSAVDRAPLLSDLKESGSIEEDADMVILLARSEENENVITIDLQKSRDGATGYFDVGWEGRYMRITNIENNYGH